MWENDSRWVYRVWIRWGGRNREQRGFSCRVDRHQLVLIEAWPLLFGLLITGCYRPDAPPKIEFNYASSHYSPCSDGRTPEGWISESVDPIFGGRPAEDGTGGGTRRQLRIALIHLEWLLLAKT